MNDIEKLREKHNEEIEELRKNCSHKKSQWVDEWWAIGHITGFQVKICDNCELEV